jgi:PAS domain S-box-containing protein
MKRCCNVGPTLIIALVFAAAAAAQEYSFRYYGAAEGLQNMVILSLAQDRAGYIWTGTEGGLYRYDGARFRLIGAAEGLPCATEAHGLFIASDGALWANACAGIYRFDGQRFHAIPGVNTLLRGAQVMADGADGAVLITTAAGIYQASRAGDGSFSMHLYPLPPTLAGRRMHGILSQGKRLWFGCDLGLCVEESGQVSVFGPKDGLPEDTWDGIQVSSDGSVWTRSPKLVYRRAPGQTRFTQENADIASSGFWGALTLMRDGSAMVPTDQGLAIHSATGWSVVDQRRGLSNELTAAVLEDREGSVWIGLIGAGLARWLGRGGWESWKTEQGLASNLIWSIRRDHKGALWVGTAAGLTRLEGSDRTRTWTRKDGLDGDNVRWLAETPDGFIWAAMKPGSLARIDPTSGKVSLVGKADGLACSPEDVFLDRHNGLWVPTACGVYRNDRPSVSNRFIKVETPESLSRRGAWKVLEDTQGTVWVTNRDGLWSLLDGKWRRHSRADGLQSDNPYVMVLASDGSIWLRHRYDAGVERVEVSGDRIVRSTAIVPADPKSVDVTAFHGFDAFGNFWRGSANGAAVLRGKTWTTFTTEDGLVWNDCDGEAFWADADGSVWLGTSGGLAHYRSGKGGLPAPLIADPIIARLEVTQRPRQIRAEFSTLNYRAEQLVRFAYRLDDAPWTDAVERNIVITGLGPGAHRLEVRGRVRDGPFSPRIAFAEFPVEPMWRETWWARLFALALLAIAIRQFLRWRLRAGARRQAALEATVAARTENLSIANRALDEKARQLRSSEDRLRLLFQQTPAGIFVFDRALRVSECNDQFLSLLQSDRDSEGGLQLSMLRELEILPAIEAALDGRHGSYEGPCATPSGFGSSSVALTTAPLWDENGRIQGGIGLAVDITERKKVEDALRESEERFRRMFEDGPLGIALVGRDFRFVRVNGALCRMVEYDEAELIQKSIFDITHPDDVVANMELAGRLFRREIPRYGMQKRYMKKNGGIIWISLTASIIRNAEGAPWYALSMMEDITESKRDQEQAIARQKLESLGVLAGGIAHDFNNLLGSILAEAELAAADLAAGSSPREELQRIMKTSIRGAEIVRELMIYSGQDKAKLAEPLDISVLVDEMLELLKVSISKRVVLNTDLCRDLFTVLGNAAQVRQIVMNLITNASEAIGDQDGVITINTSIVTGQHPAAAGDASLPEGNYVRLQVSDTGCGMTEEVQARVFDPFFSTKFAGRGLGLAVVQGIVRDHGGITHLVSAPGQGTTFEVFLPCSGQSAQSIPKAIGRPGRKEQRPEFGRLLIVEDEEVLRLAVSKLLRNRGFRVIEAIDGSAALELVRTHEDEIDMMLLDVTLPGVSSREVFEEVRVRRPNLKVILTSAYSRETVDASFAGLRVEHFIRKPFQIVDLIGLLQEDVPAAQDQR